MQVCHLGRGGFADVYLMEDSVSQKRCGRAHEEREVASDDPWINLEQHSLSCSSRPQLFTALSMFFCSRGSLISHHESCHHILSNLCEDAKPCCQVRDEMHLKGSECFSTLAVHLQTITRPGCWSEKIGHRRKLLL